MAKRPGKLCTNRRCYQACEHQQKVVAANDAICPFDDIENTDYKFLLTDNAYISYTSDLSKVTIVDKEGNIVNTNLENAYENSHISTSENQSQEVQFKKMKIFLNDLKSMNNVWNDCFTYFYNSLPGIVRSLLIFIFNVIMILICLKLVGWK